MKLIHTRVENGIWEAVLSDVSGNDPPQVEVRIGDIALTDIELTQATRPKGAWRIQVKLPTSVLSDGGGLVTVIDPASGNVIGMLQVSIGTPPEDSVAAEVNRLRQELEVVKDVIRRHLRDGDA